MKDWAVISAEGLQLLVNMDQQEAEGIMQSGNYPPAGDTPGVCYAVPMRVAETTQQLWWEYQSSFARKLSTARTVRVHEMLSRSYDTDYTKLP